MEAEKKKENDADFSKRIDAVIASIPKRLNFEEPGEVTKILQDEKFSRKVTLDHVETPIAECVRHLNAACNLAVECDRSLEGHLTLHVFDMEARDALRWIARLGYAKLNVENGALKIVKEKKQ